MKSANLQPLEVEHNEYNNVELIIIGNSNGTASI